MWMRQLGRTGIEVSALGLGTVKLGRDQGVKYPQSFVIPDDRAARHLLDLARDEGVNLIDTAPAYGSSEERLGTLLSGQRQDWVICSKVGEEFNAGVSSHDFSPAHTRFSLERSLKRLNTDYIDLVLIHSNGSDAHIIDRCGTLEALSQAREDGLIRSFGMSTKTQAGGIRAAELCDAVMATYHPGYREDEVVLDRCLQTGSAVVLKKVLASGHLPADIEDPLSVSMDFVFSHPAVTTAIVGTINPDHLRANVAAARRAVAARS